MTNVLLLSLVMSGAPGFGEPMTWNDGARARKVWLSPELVAEPSPSAELATALRALDAEAVVVTEAPTMRVWRVRDAALVREKLVTLRPVLHDLPSRKSRMRVALGLACRGEAQALPWREALSRSGEGGCTTNFWTPPVRK